MAIFPTRRESWTDAQYEEYLDGAEAGWETPIERPALRYYGGKWVLAPWIISHFPPHDSYVEPFAGAASVLLSKQPTPIEVYNDIDVEVVNFFRVLREQPDALIDALRFTPFARAELAACREQATDPVERARRTFVLSWQGRARRVQQAAGWRFQRLSYSRKTSPPADFAAVDRLYAIAERFRHVQIECDDAFAVIERYDQPQALFYCDPPYLHETRSERWGIAYAQELTDEDHARLAEALSGIQGMALVSGYDSPLYRELYAGWRMVTRRAHTDRRGALKGSGEQYRTEHLWISPNAAAAAVQGGLL